MEKKISINSFGHTYTFKTETEAIRAKKIAEILEKEIAKEEKRCELSSGHINQNIVLISVALNIINKYIDLKDRHLKLIDILSKRNNRIKAILDNGLNKPLIKEF